VKERIIDLSYAAARILGMWEKGTAPVKVEGLGPLIEPNQPFTLQVASFTDEANARQLAAQLRQRFDTSTWPPWKPRLRNIIGFGSAIRNERSGLGYAIYFPVPGSRSW